MNDNGFLLNRLIETEAVTIRAESDAFYWYAAAVPGAFYVNTEKVIGKELSATLLTAMSVVLEETSNATERAHHIQSILLRAYDDASGYREVVEYIYSRMANSLSRDMFISGGERRDWIFSVPIARQLHMGHVYLFKNGSYVIDAKQRAGHSEHVVHVADLIHNAASYTDKWLPILSEAGIEMASTLCLVSRGSRGVDVLRERGITTEFAELIDQAFMERACASGLISSGTLAGVSLYLDDPREWALQHLKNRGADVLGVEQSSTTTADRIKRFLENDPWSLADDVPDVFAEGVTRVNLRLAVASI